MSVKEVDYHCWNLLAAGGRRGRGVGVVVWRMCCPAHTGNKVSCGVGMGGVVQSFYDECVCSMALSISISRLKTGSHFLSKLLSP